MAVVPPSIIPISAPQEYNVQLTPEDAAFFTATKQAEEGLSTINTIPHVVPYSLRKAFPDPDQAATILALVLMLDKHKRDNAKDFFWIFLFVLLYAIATVVALTLAIKGL